MEISPKWVFIIFILIAVMFEVLADVLLKKWAIEDRNTILIAGFALYFISTVFWAFSLRHESFSKAIVVVTLLNLILGIGFGLLYFKDELTILQKIGIGMGFLSILLLEWE